MPFACCKNSPNWFAGFQTTKYNFEREVLLFSPSAKRFSLTGNQPERLAGASKDMQRRFRAICLKNILKLYVEKHVEAIVRTEFSGLTKCTKRPETDKTDKTDKFDKFGKYDKYGKTDKA